MSSSTAPLELGSTNLIDLLLAEQQSLTAVEAFSAHHDEAADAPAQARYYQKLLPATPPGPDEQFSFEVDLDQCSGCKACVVACHTLNGLEEDESWRTVGTITIGEPTKSETALPRIQHVTTACHHCEDPGCLSGCPVKAYDKDPVTGVVRHLDDQCIGCKYCTMMCPYEVPKYSERLGIVRKCDMCHQRLSVGEAPACVQSCPNEAISIRIVKTGKSFEQTDALISNDASCGVPSSSITTPTTIYSSEQIAPTATITAQDHGVDHVAESHWPLALMLVATQISVGMILVERVAAAIALIAGSPLPDITARLTATVALLIAGIGMGIAPMHLGQPMRAWRVFLGLRTSWLSREAVVLGKYMGLLSAAVALLWMPVLSDSVPEVVSNLIPSWAAKAALGSSLIVGIAGLISSAMIYVATKRQLWRSERTMPRFLGTGIVAGVVWTTALMMFGGMPTALYVLLAAAALASVAAKFAWEWKVYLSPTGAIGDGYDARSRRLVHGSLKNATQLRIKAAAVSAVLLVTALLVGMFAMKAAAVIGLLAAMTITVGEFAERVLYFQSVVFDRMPGLLK